MTANINRTYLASVMQAAFAIPKTTPALIDKRKEAQRMIVEAHYSHRECAEVLGVSENTISSWAARGRWSALARINSDLSKASTEVKTALARSLQSNASTLARAPISSVKELGNSPDGEGRASVLQKTVATASMLFGWDKEHESGMLAETVRFADPEPIEAEIVQKEIEDSKPLE